MSGTALPGVSGPLLVAQRQPLLPRCLQAWGFGPSEGLRAGGLLSDPQGCGRHPQFSLRSGSQAPARAALMPPWLQSPSSPSLESLARCRASGMSKTGSLIWGSTVDGCVGARAVGLMLLVLGRGQFWGQGAQQNHRTGGSLQRWGWGRTALPHLTTKSSLLK